MTKTQYLVYRRRLDIAKRTLVVIMMSLMTIGFAGSVFLKTLQILFSISQLLLKII